MNINYKIKVGEDHYWPGRVNIFIYKEIGGKRFMIYQNDNVQTEKVIEEGMMASPTLTIDREFLPSLMQQLVNLNIELPSKSHVEGKLEAQTEHLKDYLNLNETTSNNS